MPKVSVIVPVYKVENYLTRCIDSIIHQTMKDIEIIVVDEGDMDKCREIIDAFEALDSRIITIHEKQGGYGKSVNAGIERASGEYIGFVESDDFIEPKMYEKLYQKAKNMDADIVKSSFYYYFDEDHEILAPLMKNLQKELPKDRTFTLQQYPILLSTHPSIWTGIYKTKWLKDSGIRFLEKGAYVDIKFRFETLMAANRIAWIDKSTYHWRLTNPTSTNAKWNLNTAIERWEDIIHSKFEDKTELWNNFAMYMLPEANLNLFNKYGFFICTKEQRRRIKKIHALFSESSIQYCPYVSQEDRDIYLLGDLDGLALKRDFNIIYSGLACNELKNTSLKVWFFIMLLVAVFYNGYFDSIVDSSAVLKILTPVAFGVNFIFILYWLFLFIVQMWGNIHGLMKKLRK